MLLIYFSFPVILKDSPSETSSKCLRLSGCWHLWAGDPLVGWQIGQNWNNLRILPISGRFLFQTTTAPCFPKLSKNPFLCAQNQEKKKFLYRLHWNHLFPTYPAQSSQKPVRIFYLVSASFESAPKLRNACTPFLEVYFTFPFSIKCLCGKTTSASLGFVPTLKKDRTSLTAAPWCE